VLLVGDGLFDHLGIDALDDHGLTGPCDGVGTDRSLGPRGETSAQLFDERGPVRIAVRDDQRRQPPIGLQEVDRTPVCDGRDDQVGDLAKGGRRVQGRAEDPARLRHV
jgi:hypothetical protein